MSGVDLSALVREAWGDPKICVAPGLNGGWVCWDQVRALARGATEAEALGAALLAAPPKTGVGS